MSFAPSGFFVFRTPLLPFDDFLAWSNGLQTAASFDNPTRFECAFAADGQLLRARLTKIANRPEVLEALLVASPHLEDSLQVWARKPVSERVNWDRTNGRWSEQSPRRCEHPHPAAP